MYLQFSYPQAASVLPLILSLDGVEVSTITVSRRHY